MENKIKIKFFLPSLFSSLLHSLPLLPFIKFFCFDEAITIEPCFFFFLKKSQFVKYAVGLMHSLGKRFTLITYSVFYSESHLLAYSFSRLWGSRAGMQVSGERLESVHP